MTKRTRYHYKVWGVGCLPKHITCLNKQYVVTFGVKYSRPLPHWDTPQIISATASEWRIISLSTLNPATSFRQCAILMAKNKHWGHNSPEWACTPVSSPKTMRQCHNDKKLSQWFLRRNKTTTYALFPYSPSEPGMDINKPGYFFNKK